jgi:hypothetical protein
MAKKNPYVDTQYVAKEEYLKTRRQAFSVPGDILQVPIENNNTVYGVIVDMPLGPSSLGTLICYLNGACNLHFNNGDGIFRMGEKYRNVAVVSRAFVKAMDIAVNVSEKTEKFPLPSGTNHFVYLLTENGIYKTDFDITSIDNPVKRKIFNGCQNVMKELRLAQLKDRR